jgi:hypothetical protein
VTLGCCLVGRQQSAQSSPSIAVPCPSTEGSVAELAGTDARRPWDGRYDRDSEKQKSTHLAVNGLCYASSTRRVEVIQTRSNFSSAALDAIGGRSNYFARHTHYEAIAHRIVAALRGGSRHLVLVTGDPPANPQVLSEVLSNVAGWPRGDRSFLRAPS